MDPVDVLRALASATTAQLLVAAAAGAVAVVAMRHAAEGLGLLGPWDEAPAPRALVAPVAAVLLGTALATVGLIAATLGGLLRLPPPA